MGDKTITDYDNQVKALVKDTILDDNLALYREEGIIRYSKRRPQLITVELTGDGNTYSALPTAVQKWEQDFSQIIGIEYPLDESPPTYLEPKQWMIQPTPSGDRISWLGDDYPGDTEKFWVSFTARHELRPAPDNTKYTIPDADFDGVCYCIGMVYCEALARMYLGKTIPALNADTVNHQSKAIDAQKLADAMSKKYDELIPVDGYSTLADWNRAGLMSLGFLTHDRSDI